MVEDTKTDISQVVNSQQIIDLPINGRRVDNFVLLTPGVTNDGNYGLLTFRGVANGNTFLLDGNDNTEQFYVENAGRTRVQSQISQDAVQEFQVVSANFSAEYGRASGGVVNTITRSGSNQLHGAGYWFYRNDAMEAHDPYANLIGPDSRTQIGGERRRSHNQGQAVLLPQYRIHAAKRPAGRLRRQVRYRRHGQPGLGRMRHRYRHAAHLRAVRRHQCPVAALLRLVPAQGQSEYGLRPHGLSPV